jgi:hypothetical protein
MSRMDPMPSLRMDTATATRPAPASTDAKIKAQAVSVFYGDKQACSTSRSTCRKNPSPP